jgi:DNA-binding transcriptional MocR family regulator
MWDPKPSKVRPFYRSIVAELERDIGSGRLANGERLPSHRELARRLGVTVGTVTKAFTEAERQGLVASRVGRGSYVQQFPEDVDTVSSDPNGVIDLSVNTATIQPLNTALNRILGALSRRKSLYHLLEYHPVPGLERHRAAGAKWLRLRGIDATPDRIIVCNGSQEALMAVMAVITKPGDSVLTENMNYAGIKRLADLFPLDIRGVPTDEQGLRPDLLAAAAKGTQVGAILCSPTLHNPTNAMMPLERRREIIRVAEELDAYVIEDDSYGHLSGDSTPTIASLAPDRCIYLCGTSKSVAPGLRIGFMFAPVDIMERLYEGIHAMSWTSPSVMGEIATVLIEEGIAEDFVAWHRKEASERLDIAREILGMPSLQPNCPSYHIWLTLPPPWRAGDFVAQVRLRGVLISPADSFAVDRSPVPHAVRICLGSTGDRKRLKQGLTLIKDVLAARPTSATLRV